MKNLSLTYPAKFTQHNDDGESYFVVEIEQLNIVTDGVDFEEAMFNARDALDCALLAALELNDEVPEPHTVRKGEVLVSSSSEVAVPYS